MPECDCNRLDRTFNAKVADDDLRDYLHDGPDASTRILIDAMDGSRVVGRTLLDIGGGIGVIQLELLARGLRASTDVDVSSAYIEVAQREATRRGYGDRTAYHRGDFVAVAGAIGPADLVTLDRVICCYPNLDSLVVRAAERTRERLGLVHPRDPWWLRIGVAVMNAVSRPFGAMRFYVHRTARIEAILRSAGLELEWSGGTRFWRVATYRRVASPSPLSSG